MFDKYPTGFLTEDEAAALAGVSTRTIRRRVADGELAQYRGPDRRRAYFREADVLALITPCPTD